MYYNILLELHIVWSLFSLWIPDMLTEKCFLMGPGQAIASEAPAFTRPCTVKSLTVKLHGNMYFQASQILNFFTYKIRISTSYSTRFYKN